MLLYHLIIEKKVVEKLERGKRKNSTQTILISYIIDGKEKIDSKGFINLSKEPFDLYSILGDLLDYDVYEHQKKDEKSKPIFLPERFFKKKIYIGIDNRFSILLKDLKNIVKNNIQLNNNLINNMCYRYNSSIHYRIDILDERNENIEDNYETLLYNPLIIKNIKTDNLTNSFPNTKNTTIMFDYECKNCFDIIIAILHFLQNFNINFFKCPICNKYSFYFIERGRKPKYCNRIGEHRLESCFSKPQKSKNYTCAIAVDTIKDNIFKKKETIIKFLENKFNAINGIRDYCKEKEEFSEDFHNLLILFNQDSTRTNLINLYDFVNDEKENYWNKYHNDGKNT